LSGSYRAAALAANANTRRRFLAAPFTGTRLAKTKPATAAQSEYESVCVAHHQSRVRRETPAPTLNRNAAQRSALLSMSDMVRADFIEDDYISTNIVILRRLFRQISLQ